MALLALWAVAVAIGLAALWRYGASPGEPSFSPTSWPADSEIVRDGRPTLLVFAHPLCPCTRATLSELERLTAKCQSRVDTHVVFIDPQGTDGSWQDSELVRIARNIQGSRIEVDTDRREAARFGVRTSGACLLYDPLGKLVFRGGLTAARGHEGDNVGADSIKTYLMNDQRQSPRAMCLVVRFLKRINSPFKNPTHDSPNAHLSTGVRAAARSSAGGLLSHR